MSPSAFEPGLRKIARTVLSAPALAAVVILLSSAGAIAAGDPTAGQKDFGRCAGCHSTVPGQNKIGPSLAGVVDRKSGSEPGFAYSPALKNANITWDGSSLDKYLANPTGYVHGSRMFVDLPDATARQDIIAYLGTLKP